MGFSEAQFGILCQKILTPNIRLPENVSLDQGAIVEPLAVAMHASDRAQLPAGTTALILGAGAVGLLCAAVTMVSKPKAVVIADVQADRVKFAVDNGFAHAGVVVPMKRPEAIADKLAFAKEMSETVKGTTVNGEAVGEVGACYECTGVESCLQTAIYVSLSLGYLHDEGGALRAKKILRRNSRPSRAARSC